MLPLTLLSPVLNLLYFNTNTVVRVVQPSCHRLHRNIWVYFKKTLAGSSVIACRRRSPCLREHQLTHTEVYILSTKLLLVYFHKQKEKHLFLNLHRGFVIPHWCFVIHHYWTAIPHWWFKNRYREKRVCNGEFQGLWVEAKEYEHHFQSIHSFPSDDNK